MKSIPILANMRARTTTGIVLSLLIHVLILWFAMDRAIMPVAETGNAVTAPLTVDLLTPMPVPSPAPTASVTPPAAPAQASAARKKTAVSDKDVKNSARAKPPPPAPKSAAKTPLPPDMNDMLNAARERRRAAGIAEPDNSLAQDDNAIARANIAEMMQKQSRGRNESGGVFQITYKGVRTAEFLFRGWDLRRRTNSRQLILVDAGPGIDIDTAIVRRMIELIRQYEKGDFHWNSPRLGRVVVLSARVSDSRELEDFLKRDFFDTLP